MDIQNAPNENVNASDTTIISHNGKYWMFCNIVENIGASSYDELFYFIPKSYTQVSGLHIQKIL